MNTPFSFLVTEEITNHDDIFDDDAFFKMALGLARFALGSTHPNPSVGAVLAKDDQLIASGFTEPPGGKHAEKKALANASSSTGATIYSTLEPCCHFGRTPPCTDAIISAGISRVVYGVVDPNPVVSGKGINALNAAGIKTELIRNHELAKQASLQILPFATWLQKKRPYVVVKVAMSNDFKIGKMNTRTKITGVEADVVVHSLRRACDAVLVSARTVRVDNPMLTSRLGDDGHGHQPLRVVISSDLNLDENAEIFDMEIAQTVILTVEGNENTERFKNRGVPIIGCKTNRGRVDLLDAMEKLAALGITSVLVESGAELFHSFLKDGLVDEAWFFRSSSLLGPEGLSLGKSDSDLAAFSLMPIMKTHVGLDELVIFAKI